MNKFVFSSLSILPCCGIEANTVFFVCCIPCLCSLSSLFSQGSWLWCTYTWGAPKATCINRKGLHSDDYILTTIWLYFDYILPTCPLFLVFFGFFCWQNWISWPNVELSPIARLTYSESYWSDSSFELLGNIFEHPSQHSGTCSSTVFHCELPWTNIFFYIYSLVSFWRVRQGFRHMLW